MNWWNSLDRQQRVGWTLIICSLGYILYFCKVRLFSPGPAIEQKEWIYLVGTIAAVMLGTVNIRMAEARQRNEKVMPLVDPTKILDPKQMRKK